MAANTIKIDELCLRIPGLMPQEAHQVGNEVARRLAMRLPERVAALHLGALDLRLTVPQGAGQSEAVDLIVDAIVKRLA